MADWAKAEALINEMEEWWVAEVGSYGHRFGESLRRLIEDIHKDFGSEISDKELTDMIFKQVAYDMWRLTALLFVFDPEVVLGDEDSEFKMRGYV